MGISLYAREAGVHRDDLALLMLQILLEHLGLSGSAARHRRKGIPS